MPPMVNQVPGRPASPGMPAWQRLRQMGIAGQGSAAANKSTLAAQGTPQPQPQPPALGAGLAVQPSAAKDYGAARPPQLTPMATSPAPVSAPVDPAETMGIGGAIQGLKAQLGIGMPAGAPGSGNPHLSMNAPLDLSRPRFQPAGPFPMGAPGQGQGPQWANETPPWMMGAGAGAGAGAGNPYAALLRQRLLGGAAGGAGGGLGMGGASIAASPAFM